MITPARHLTPVHHRHLRVVPAPARPVGQVRTVMVPRSHLQLAVAASVVLLCVMISLLLTGRGF